MKKKINVEAVNLWEDRIKQIESTGNCSNGAHLEGKYFSEKYIPEEMVIFCRKMIDRLKDV